MFTFGFNKTAKKVKEQSSTNLHSIYLLYFWKTFCLYIYVDIKIC